MKTIITFTVLLFFVSSCKKQVTVSGRVYNPVTGQGISGIEVKVFKQKNGVPGSLDGSGSKLIFSTTTDAEGKYIIADRLSKNKTYDLRFVYDEDLYYQVEGSLKNIGVDDDNTTVDWELVPKGLLSININNTNCFDNNDLLNIYFIHRSVSDLFGSSAESFYGCYSHNGNSNDVPMGWYVCMGNVTKNNISSPFKDSIYVTAGGFHTWNINY